MPRCWARACCDGDVQRQETIGPLRPCKRTDHQGLGYTASKHVSCYHPRLPRGSRGEEQARPDQATPMARSRKGKLWLCCSIVRLHGTLVSTDDRQGGVREPLQRNGVPRGLAILTTSIIVSSHRSNNVHAGGAATSRQIPPHQWSANCILGRRASNKGPVDGICSPVGAHDGPLRAIPLRRGPLPCAGSAA